MAFRSARSTRPCRAKSRRGRSCRRSCRQSASRRAGAASTVAWASTCAETRFCRRRRRPAFVPSRRGDAAAADGSRPRRGVPRGYSVERTTPAVRRGKDHRKRTLQVWMNGATRRDETAAASRRGGGATRPPRPRGAAAAFDRCSRLARPRRGDAAAARAPAAARRHSTDVLSWRALVAAAAATRRGPVGVHAAREPAARSHPGRLRP